MLAVSLGPDGGHVLKRVRLEDPLMVAAPLYGPAVVLNTHGIVTLLGWHSLRPLKVFRGFSDPQVARIAPGDRFAYVADGGSGEISVIDLAKRRIVHRVYVGLQAHHMSFSPNGRRLWIALGEVATTIVRLDGVFPEDGAFTHPARARKAEARRTSRKTEVTTTTGSRELMRPAAI